MRETPDEVVERVMEALGSSAPVDLSPLNGILTEVGKEVVHWLAEQPWVRAHPKAGRILERRPLGTRYEIDQIYDLPAGAEKVTLVLFTEEDRWKFHDIYVSRLRDVRFEMDLSYVLRHRSAWLLEVARKNPDLAVQRVLEQLPTVISVAGTLASLFGSIDHLRASLGAGKTPTKR